MAEYPTDQPGAPAALPEPPGFPWITVLTGVLVLFVFGALVAAVLFFATEVPVGSYSLPGERQLQELRAQQRDIVENDGYDPATKTWRIPVERAMNTLAEEGKTKGELQSFPAKPKEMKK